MPLVVQTGRKPAARSGYGGAHFPEWDFEAPAGRNGGTKIRKFLASWRGDSLFLSLWPEEKAVWKKGGDGAERG